MGWHSRTKHLGVDTVFFAASRIRKTPCKVWRGDFFEAMSIKLLDAEMDDIPHGYLAQ